MRLLVLCCLFTLGVSGLIAKQPPPPPQPLKAWIKCDVIWNTIQTTQNGDLILWPAFHCQGDKGFKYYVTSYVDDSNGTRHNLFPWGGGQPVGAWYLGDNYNGTVKWNSFSVTVTKNSQLYNDIVANGGIDISGGIWRESLGFEGEPVWGIEDVDTLFNTYTP